MILFDMCVSTKTCTLLLLLLLLLLFQTTMPVFTHSEYTYDVKDKAKWDDLLNCCIPKSAKIDTSFNEKKKKYRTEVQTNGYALMHHLMPSIDVPQDEDKKLENDDAKIVAKVVDMMSCAFTSKEMYHSTQFKGLTPTKDLKRICKEAIRAFQSKHPDCRAWKLLQLGDLPTSDIFLAVERKAERTSSDSDDESPKKEKYHWYPSTMQVTLDGCADGGASFKFDIDDGFFDPFADEASDEGGDGHRLKWLEQQFAKWKDTGYVGLMFKPNK